MTFFAFNFGIMSISVILAVLGCSSGQRGIEACVHSGAGCLRR